MNRVRRTTSGSKPHRTTPFFGNKAGGAFFQSAVHIQRKKKPLGGFSKPGQTIFSNDTDTERNVDQAIQQSPVIAPHIKAKIKKGVKIEGEVTYHYDRKSFEQRCAGIGNPTDECKSVGGFYDRKKDEVHLPPRPNIEALVHEAVHKYANDFRGLPAYINEGITQVFANTVLDESGLSKGNAYPNEVEVGEAIRDKVGGRDKLAEIFFSKGPKDLGDALFKNPRNTLGQFVLLALKKKKKELIAYIKNN